MAIFHFRYVHETSSMLYHTKCTYVHAFPVKNIIVWEYIIWYISSEKWREYSGLIRLIWNSIMMISEEKETVTSHSAIKNTGWSNLLPLNSLRINIIIDNKPMEKNWICYTKYTQTNEEEIWLHVFTFVQNNALGNFTSN